MAVFFFFQPLTREMKVTQPSCFATPNSAIENGQGNIPPLDRAGILPPNARRDGSGTLPTKQGKEKRSPFLLAWHPPPSRGTREPESPGKGLFHRKFWAKEASLSPDKDSNPETPDAGQHQQEGICHNKHPSQEVLSAPKGREEPAQESLFISRTCSIPSLIYRHQLRNSLHPLWQHKEQPAETSAPDISNKSK